mmetsp:Transcript_19409/g.41365  ORF Transcript_19409/g.41365 Transcript_19409/m.41365 type:complete len:438 (-) Transcript_19409:108-1421(-)
MRWVVFLVVALLGLSAALSETEPDDGDERCASSGARGFSGSAALQVSSAPLGRTAHQGSSMPTGPGHVIQRPKAEASVDLLGAHPDDALKAEHLATMTRRTRVMLPASIVTIAIVVLAEIAPTTWTLLQAWQLVGLLAATGLVCMNSFVHMTLLVAPVGFYGLFLVRCLACLIFGHFMAKTQTAAGRDVVELWPADKSLQVKILLRAVSGNVTMLLNFAALSYTPAAVVMIITSTRTIWASLLSYFLLGETLSWKQLVCMGLGLTAVVLMIISSADARATGTDLGSHFRPGLGTVLAGLASLTWASSGVIIRSARGQVHYLTMVWWLGLVGLLMCCPMGFIIHLLGYSTMLKAVLMPSTGSAGMIFAVAVSSFVFCLYMNKASQMAKAGPVMLTMTGLAIIIQFCVDLVIFGDKFGPLAWVSFSMLTLYLVLSARLM